jgi:NAD(P)-dependent dehydrogenase (short-subunit alcohol dehydrogenase family)
MFDFSDQVVMVTGAAGNLGRAVARRFRAAGARLVLVDRASDRLPRLFPDLLDDPHALLANSVDVTEPHLVTAAVAETIERFGRIDVLVNTVGGYRGGKPVADTPLELWDDVFDLNARSAFIVSSAVAPHMLAQGSGRIVNVGSKSALQGSRRSAAYSAAKSAVVRLTESLAADLKREGITANCVLPSTLDTPENRENMPSADPSRWVTPEEVADVILFLASDAARAVQGAAIPVYGRG